MRRPLAFLRRHWAATSVAAAVLLCCAVAGVVVGVRASAGPVTPLQTLFLDYQDYLLTRPDVVSVGIGERQGVSYIQVYVSRLTPQVTAAIPRRLGGWPISVKAVKVKTPHPRKPRPTPLLNPSRASQLAIGQRGTVTAVVMLAHPTSKQALGSLFLDTGDRNAPESIAVTRKTRFYKTRGKSVVPLPATVFTRLLRGHTIVTGLVDVNHDGGLARGVAVTVVLLD